jgi:ankyrin repeat protein
MRALPERGAQVGLTESFRGQTALTFAAGEGDTDAAKLLLESGARLNEHSKGGYTPLLLRSATTGSRRSGSSWRRALTSRTRFPTARPR